jgi:hypothetical protein
MGYDVITAMNITKNRRILAIVAHFSAEKWKELPM